MVYVNVHFRLDGPINAPTFNAQIDKILSNTKRLVDSSESIKHSVQETAEHTKGSFITEVLDGASVVAPYVVPLAAYDGRLELRPLRSIAQNIPLRDDNCSDVSEAREDESIPYPFEELCKETH